MLTNFLYAKEESRYSCAVLRESDEWGLRTLDLVHPPGRFWGDREGQDLILEGGVDQRRVKRVASPSEILRALPPGDTWQAQSRRSLTRLYAHYLICEDPQRRMDVREVETLSHQVSLVRHILQHEGLRRVLIADEVGLGKTVEVGLLLKELLAQSPGLRVLYLAPARLVSNVRREFDRLRLNFRQWAASDGDAKLSDPRIIASLHRAVHGRNNGKVLETPPWDVIIVDECHHLSAWSPEGGDPTEAYRLIKGLISRQPSDGRVILLSGTPHQGHISRFDNLLKFLRSPQEKAESLAGRVIYRTKDDIQDWAGNPVFPQRQINEPLIVDLGPAHREWLKNIHDYYCPPREDGSLSKVRQRAVGWRCAQAMQWAASSPHAGLGYLVRQAIRSGWKKDNPTLVAALTVMRPYRLGRADEPVDHLFDRIFKEVERQRESADVEDIETGGPDREDNFLSDRGLERLLAEGVELVKEAGDDKWEIIWEKLLHPAGDEKVVLFAQPIETVTALARYLERRTGRRPALIIGGQTDAEREKAVQAFRLQSGPQFLVSSRAGGEGINLQVARRLVHIDVPWNPMELEQRVGRVHRFGSTETIIVDTAVVKESREAAAYSVARRKLELIASTLVEQERFESVFSRVMCLLPQEDLQHILLNSPAGPLDLQDEQKLAEMVQKGFRQWKEFHDRYGEEQRTIAHQNPGLLRWDDVAHFLEEHGGALRQDGFRRQRFHRNGEAVERREVETSVLKLADGGTYVCSDHDETQVYGPDRTMTPRLGLNLAPVAELIRQHAFPAQACGAAYVRWPQAVPRPELLASPPGRVLVFLRQSVRQDKNGAWLEHGSALWCYVLIDGSPQRVEGEEKRNLLRGLFRAVVRREPESDESRLHQIAAAEREIAEELRRPTEEELRSQIRHAVAPLLAAMITE